MSKLYALLVGINAYPAPTHTLQGCLNDIDNARDYLKEFFPDAAVAELRDGNATHANVVAQFRQHLGKAESGDVAMLHYCGHGASPKAAPEFAEFDRSGRDEELVLVDGRLDDKHFGLADKELAWLLGELRPKGAHVAMILDCCHSGSGTRDLDDDLAGVRMTGAPFPPRAIETYLEGQFAAAAKTKSLAIPTSRHILLAACDRSQTSKEDLDDHRGFFTTALFNVLRRSGEGLSYADLFVRTRAAVRQRIRDKGKSAQDPQFETMGGFDGYAGVFGRLAARAPRTYSTSFADGRWTVEIGAVQGLPTDPARPVTFKLHPESDPAAEAGTARAIRVGAQTSEIVPDFAADQAARYLAELTSLPSPPLLVAFEGADEARRRAEQALAVASANVALVATGEDDGFALVADASAVKLVRRDGGRVIRQAAMLDAAMLEALAHVGQWQRSLALADPRPRLDPVKVEFVFAERKPDNQEFVHNGPDLTVEVSNANGIVRNPKGKLLLRNTTGQLLHYALVHFSQDFGVEVITNEQITPGDAWQTIIPPGKRDTPEFEFNLKEGGDSLVENLKLIVSTERVDDFLLALPPLRDERGFGAAEPDDAAKPVTDDWFTRDMRVRVVRVLDAVGPAPASLAGGAITVEAHPGVTASLALSTAAGGARGEGDDLAILRKLAPAGLMPASVAGTRGDDANVLELTGIEGAGTLAETPLMLRLDLPRAPGEAVVPLLHDGRHVLLPGEIWLGDDGATHVAIDRIPDSAIDQRSLGGALKMYLLKTYLGVGDVNKLRRAEFDAAGGVIYRSDDIPARVAAATNVLLVIHGIIGDTSAMLAGVQASGVAGQFDLVLSYDYENLSTPIADTARRLRDELAAVGLRADDGKRLTILAHSMGGLVSRWMIEREGGNALVDHLVMCGTPNAGSPLGRVGGARKILEMLATLGLNFMPLVAGPALALLARSKKLTPTLEQMAPESEFIATLNASPDPGVRYSILAGDIDKYHEPTDQFFEELLVKAGRGAAFDALFGDRPNDIAVGVASIFGAGAGVARASHADVPCHHLNYFSTDVGRAALKAVTWAP